MKIEFAPVQGHTDSAYREIFARNYDGVDGFYTPFIRKEKEGIRPRDLRDSEDAVGESSRVAAQVIFRDIEELTFLVNELYGKGYKRIDLNMGCPFPLQTARGRGAATIGNSELAREVSQLTHRFADVDFSVKMRLGLKNPDDWRVTLEELNQARLIHITMHPRVASQQYGGTTDLDRFRQFIDSSAHPVLYNGDITSPLAIPSAGPDDEEDSNPDWRRFENHPNFAGIMLGRGLLGRPSLAMEIRQNSELPSEERLRRMLEFHRQLLRHYRDSLCGDAQVLSKIKPFWEYAELEIGRKAWKAIKKASNMAKYQTAIATIL